MFDVSVDMVIYIIIALVVVVLDVLSIMDGNNFSNLKLNKKISIYRKFILLFYLCYEITQCLHFNRLKHSPRTLQSINTYTNIEFECHED